MPRDAYAFMAAPAMTSSPYAQHDETEYALRKPVRIKRDVFRMRLRKGREVRGTPKADIWARLYQQR